MENKIIDVPKEIDIQIADALKAMDVKIDKLTPEQIQITEVMAQSFSNHFKKVIDELTGTFVCIVYS